MKRFMKEASKLLAIFLSVLFVIQILPMETVAASVNDYLDNLPVKETTPTEATSILYEVKEKRDENTKVYKISDGTYSAFISPTPIHYYEDNEWKDIDNTIVENDDGSYTNASNTFDVNLPSKLTDNSSVSVSKDGYNVSFTLNDSNNKWKGKVNNKRENEKAENIDDIASEINTSSSVEYKNALSNTDVEYVLSGNEVKENIIIDKWSAVKQNYVFTIRVTGLTASANEDGSILFCNELGEEKFTVPAPVMYDKNNISSKNIAVSLTTNDDNSYSLTYTPDRTWLQANDRAYPVTLDPVIMEANMSVITDACVTSDSPDTNGNNSILGIASNGYEIDDTACYAEMYLRIHTELLQPILDDATITEAQIISLGGGEGKIALKEIESDCDFSTVTYNTKPTLAPDIVDYYTGLGSVDGNSYVHFNVTNYLNKIISNNEANKGLAVVALDNTSYGVLFGNGTVGNETIGISETNGLGIIINYIDSKGYDSRNNYHSQDVGKAGTVYVNDFTRDLFLTREDVSIDGNIMPISLSFMYNSAISEIYNCVLDPSANEENTDKTYVYGENWISNYNRIIHINEMGSNIGMASVEYLTEDGTVLCFYAQNDTDENGNNILSFVEENSDKYGSSGYSVELLETPENYDGTMLDYIQITRPDGNIERFDENGRLVSVSKIAKTSAGSATQQIIVTYVSDLSENSNFLAIDYITDGTGRKFDFTYDETTGLLSNIKCYMSDGNQINSPNSLFYLMSSYTYTNNNLTKVVKNSSDTTNYTYNESNQLTSASTSQLYKIEYTYDAAGKVSQITDYARNSTLLSYTQGNTLQIVNDGPYQTKFITSQSNPQIEQLEQFDNCGKIIGVTDANGNYAYTSYDSNDIYGNSSGNVTITSNYLDNSSFENGLSSWSSDSLTTNDITTEFSDSNASSLKIQSDSVVSKKISQTVSVGETDSYTFSAYVKAADDNITHMLTMRIIAGNTAEGSYMENVRTIAAVGNDFEKYSVQISPQPVMGLESFDYITVEIGLENSAGEFYIDSLQLESGNGTGKYDYLTNSNLNNMLNNSNNGWSINSDYTVGTSNICNHNNSYVKYSNANNLNSNNVMSQSVIVNGKENDVLTFGGWVKADITYNGQNTILQKLAEESPNMNVVTDRTAGLKIEYTYSTNENGTVVTKTETVIKQINSFVSDWQYVSNSIALKGDCTDVNVSFVYQNHPGDVYVSKMSLTKETSDLSTEDEENEIIDDTQIVPDESLETGEKTYCICGDNCAYGEGCTCTCTSEEECNCPQCKKKFDIVYDEHGNITSFMINGFDFGNLISMFNAKSYTADGNYLLSSTNENNKTTQYSYNPENGYLDSVTDVKNSNTSYGYSAVGNMTSVSKSVTPYNSETSSTMTTTYAYDDLDRITSIYHNGFAYFIGYDIWSNVKYIRVGLSGSLINSRNLVTYEYGTGINRNQLISATYANGGTTTYTYDNNGNVISIVNSNGNATVPQKNTYKYYYDSTGKVICEYDEVDSEPTRITYYNDNSTEIYSNGGLEYYVAYDEDGNVIENINGTTYESITYDTENLDETNKTSSKSVVTNGTNTVGFTKLTDAFGRTEQKALFSKDPTNTETTSDFSAVLTDYTYKLYTKDNNSMASSQIDSVENKIYYGNVLSDDNVNNSFNLAYDYDDNNNIIYEYAVEQDGTRTVRYHYVYDEADQLIRFDDHVNKDENNAYHSYVYTYNVGGNRTSTKIYNYTLGELIDEPTTITQTYGLNLNNNLMLWNDRLKTYNGKEITYDLEGNPTEYDGKTYVWNGKQLKQITAADSTYTQYDYDINGLRTQKRQYDVDGTLMYIVDYVWSDGKIITQSLSVPITITIHGVTRVEYVKIDSKFVYADDEETPCAIMIADNEYLLVRDLQGDVIAVVDGETGEAIVEFSYDAWGNISYHFCDEWTTGKTDEEISQMEMLITVLCPVTYRGYNYDFTTGLYYLQSRYYNAEWGRFLNTDDTSILLSTTGTTHGANMYAYCNNNPVNRADYDGKKSKDYGNDLLCKILNILSPYVSTNYFNVNLQRDNTCIFKLRSSDNEFYNAIKNAKKINITLTYLSITLIANMIIKTSIQRYFLFSIDCMFKEIMVHFEGYSIGKALPDGQLVVDNPSNLLGVGIYNGLSYVGGVFRDHCNDCDIAENDVSNTVQSLLFGYNKGIRNVYYKTLADPYFCANGTRIKKSSIDSANTDWKNHLKDYGYLRGWIL